jgi:gas vesicle protein
MAFKTFVVGLATGAALMYLFDPRQGRERRETLGERLSQGRHEAEDVVERGRQTFEQVRERTRSTADDLQEQAGETARDARSEIEQMQATVSSGISTDEQRDDSTL